jgi:hypothetical protein
MAISWKVCPWDLLMVMAKAGRTGHWRRRIWMGMVLSSASVFMLMRGITDDVPYVAAREDLGLNDGAG